MNVGAFDNNPKENIVLPWLLSYTSSQIWCHCNGQLRVDILCVKGLPYQHPAQYTFDRRYINFHLIEFTYLMTIFHLKY